MERGALSISGSEHRLRSENLAFDIDVWYPALSEQSKNMRDQHQHRWHKPRSGWFWGVSVQLLCWAGLLLLPDLSSTRSSSRR